MAPKRQPKTLLEWNVLLAMGSLMSEAQLKSGRKLPVMEQARLMAKAMPKATRVGEFVAMWTVAKNEVGEVNVEKVAEVWKEPVRTMYRRLEEFREVWSPAGHDTPDKLADALIADYRARQMRLSGRHLAALLSVRVSVPLSGAPSSLSL